VSAKRSIRPRFAVDPPVLLFAIALALSLGAFGLIAGTDPDEEYALASTAHGFAYAMHRAIAYELQAPLWFGVMGLWRSLDKSIFFARAFSLGCIAATCFASRSIALRIRPALHPLPFVIVVALNPFAVYAALEVRLYAAAVLISALLWIAFFDGFLGGERRAARIWFVVLALVGIYVQYYLGFALVGGGCALLLARRFPAFRAYAVCALIVALGALPAVFLAHLEAGAVRETLPAMAGFPLRHMAEPLFQFALPFSYVWYEDPTWYGFLTAYKIGILALFALFALGRPRLRSRELGYAGLALGIWASFLLAEPFLHVKYEVPRHFVGLFVPEIAAGYALVTSLSAPRRRLCAAAMVGIYAAFGLATLWTTYRFASKPGDWRRVGAYINARVAKDDVVAVFAPDALPAFLRVYRGAAPAVAFPRTPDPENYDPDLYDVASDADARVAIARIANGRRIWLVLYGQCNGSVPNYGCVHVASAAAALAPGMPVARFYEGEVAEVPPLRGRKNLGRSSARGIKSASGERPVARRKNVPLRATANTYVTVLAAAAPSTP
jgi:hypothetical protein